MEKLNELALFAGIGGGILGGKLLEWETVCAVEIEPYCSSILAQRQNDGLLPPFPIWDDVSTFDGHPWRGIVDVISGGFPCQDISSAGGGGGIEGDRSGLWKEFARIICEVRPRYAFIENSPMLTLRGLDTVLCDLASMGFDAKWGVLGASSVGADHARKRIWIAANTPSIRLERGDNIEEKRQREAKAGSMEGLRENKVFDDIPPPNSFGDPNGIPARVDRLKAIGNGQVPQCAAAAWRILTKGVRHEY